MKRKGSVLLLVLLILTPLLLMSACLWRSVAYSVELVHASHTAHQQHALTKAGLLLVLKRLTTQQTIADQVLQFKGWPCACSTYDLEIKIEAQQDCYQAHAYLLCNKNLVCTLSAYYVLDSFKEYKVYYVSPL